jgi:hypothetical protein
MPNGWVQVRIPDTLLAQVVQWRVCAGTAVGQPGERIPVSPGELVVTIEADLKLPALWASGTLSVPVRVEPGALTCVNLARTSEPWRL